jgi:hypothetical protein
MPCGTPTFYASTADPERVAAVQVDKATGQVAFDYGQTRTGPCAREAYQQVMRQVIRPELRRALRDVASWIGRRRLTP